NTPLLYHPVVLLRFRLDSKANGSLRLNGSFGLVLQKGFALIEWHHNGKEDSGPQHHVREKHEITRALQFHTAVRILYKESDTGRENVSGRKGQLIRPHAQGLHFGRALVIGKLVVRR